MYDTDSFFTLTWAGRTGLVALSATMTICLLWLQVKITRGFARWIRIVGAVVLLWLFVWLSPQVYFLYYVLIFDAVDVSFVTGAPPHPMVILSLLTFTAKPTLAHHGMGLMGWAMIVVAFRRKPVG